VDQERQGDRCFHRHFKWLLAVIATGACQPIWATGFQLPVQNVTNLGTAYAGTGSLAEDASINYYNVAGLTRLREEQIVLGGTLNLLRTSLNVTRATATTGALLSSNIEHAKPANSALIPFFHYAKRIDDRWIFGLSGVATFGSKATYLEESIVRCMDTKSTLRPFNLSPSLAYSFCNGLSIGAGVDAVHAEAYLYSHIGSGNLATDGAAEISGSRWAMGYHAGLLYEIDNGTRFGLSYRSPVKIKLKGNSELQLFAGAPFISQSIRADLKLPDFTILSAYHAFNDRWAIMGDFRWTHWKLFDQLALRFEDGSQLISRADYKNSYMLAVGGTYQCNEQWQFKAGAAFDKTPTRDTTRTIYLPDQNQTILGLGTKYNFSECLAIHFCYAHIFYKKANINQTAPIAIGVRQGLQNVRGTSRTQMDVLGLQFTWDLA
jgi:long-chain fatty acid transport protein